MAKQDQRTDGDKRVEMAEDELDAVAGGMHIEPVVQHGKPSVGKFNQSEQLKGRDKIAQISGTPWPSGGTG